MILDHITSGSRRLGSIVSDQCFAARVLRLELAAGRRPDALAEPAARKNGEAEAADADGFAAQRLIRIVGATGGLS